MEVKYKQFAAAREAHGVIDEANKKFEDIFARSYPSVAPHKTNDAEIALVCAGAVSGTVRVAVDQLRDEGVKIGMVKIRTFRPFPHDRIRETLGHIPNIGIIDKCIIPGAGGPLAQEIRAAIYGIDSPPYIRSFIAGLGGRDITLSTVRDAVGMLDKDKKTPDPIFLGLKE
jgi:pyruvate/2-oxoacid:ferredoxin oxidoreductase alpha subunit